MTTSKTEPPSLIVTACLDDASFAVLDALRRRHFPPTLNKVPAHISLFHRLPGGEADTIVDVIRARCRRTVRFSIEPAGVTFTGRGVALAYRSDELSQLHGDLAREWGAWLTPQDRQPFRAHVTIQNKVEPALARALYETLRGEPISPCTIDGIAVWRYVAGAWDRLETCFF